MESFKQTGTNQASLIQGPLEQNNLTYDNAMGLDEMQDSPRAAFKRARDRSVRELSESFHASRSRSPASNRLQSYVDLETASPHHHTGQSPGGARSQHSASITMTAQNNISVTDTSAHKIATQHPFSSVATRTKESIEFQKRQGNFLSQPYDP